MENAIEILWYGRGGQGAFSAARLLGAAYALSSSDRHALAFPSFGPERRGAPVHAYTKLSTYPINDRSAVQIPDIALCLDSTLISDFAGMQIREGGFVVTTSSEVEALAKEVLGRPIVNTVLLALACAKSGLMSEDEICYGIDEALPSRIREKNKILVRQAFENAPRLLATSVFEPSAPESHKADGGFEHMNLNAAADGLERMNLYTADSFSSPQQAYVPPSVKRD